MEGISTRDLVSSVQMAKLTNILLHPYLNDMLFYDVYNKIAKIFDESNAYNSKLLKLLDYDRKLKLNLNFFEVTENYTDLGPYLTLDVLRGPLKGKTITSANPNKMYSNLHFLHDFGTLTTTP